MVWPLGGLVQGGCSGQEVEMVLGPWDWVNYTKGGVTPCTPEPLSSGPGMLAVTTGCPEGA